MNYFDNNFVEHPSGSYGLYGLNMLGCDSTIKYLDQIWRFKYFKTNSDVPVYINKNGEYLEINLKQAQNVTRMQIVK